MNGQPRQPLLGVILSIVLPGLGQVYAGNVIRGLISFSIVMIPAAGFVVYFLQPQVKIYPWWFAPFVVALVLDAMIVVDAYRQVARYNTARRLVVTSSKKVLALLYAGVAAAVVVANVFFVGISAVHARVVASYITPPDSMAPSVYAGERVFVDLNAYKKAIPKRGDVVLYRSPDPSGKGIVSMHRVVGLPGESIELRNHRVMINGVAVKEPWCERIHYYNRGKFGQMKKPVTVPPDSYYIIGDASASSNDSRFWGFIPHKNLIGRVFKIYYPFARSGPV